ncbi:hypothetical protein ACFOLL_17115 [Falsochrobactrum ovis]|nr:hypothetical protein [Falsochrobactrum ovis]
MKPKFKATHAAKIIRRLTAFNLNKILDPRSNPNSEIMDDYGNAIRV